MTENGACEFPLLPPERKCGQHRALRWRKLLNVAGLRFHGEDKTVKRIIPMKEGDRWGGWNSFSHLTHSYNIVCAVYSSFHPISFHISYPFVAVERALTFLCIQ